MVKLCAYYPFLYFSVILDAASVGLAHQESSLSMTHQQAVKNVQQVRLSVVKIKASLQALASLDSEKNNNSSFTENHGEP